MNVIKKIKQPTAYCNEKYIAYLAWPKNDQCILLLLQMITKLTDQYIFILKMLYFDVYSKS